MNIWRKTAVCLLLLLCLITSLVPAAYAADAEAGRGLDFSELEHQIGIANGLNSYDYTIETWELLQQAVEHGNSRLEGADDQTMLDNAADDIADAVAGLVKMDYSRLIEMLDAVYAEIDKDPERHDIWYRLDKAVDKARPLLISGDQQAVNEMAAQLEAQLRELDACGVITVEPEIIIQEVEVEVPPSSDFCNIPKHHTWPVLFLVSVVLNVLLFAAFGYVLFAKRKTADNTPLVDYDIDDDMDL